MIEMIKEIGIFIVIAQALLYFVPGQAYEKYVKVVIGIAMIAKLADPVLSLFTDFTTDDFLEEAMNQSFSYMEQQDSVSLENGEENGQTMLLCAIEEELAKRLKKSPVEGYEAEEVLLRENVSGEVQGIVITVSESSGKEKTEIEIEKITVAQGNEEKRLMKEEEDKLKQYYGTILEIPPEQIEICLK